MKKYLSETPVHDAFGLTYAAYYCVPRLMLQNMPVKWQGKFVELAEMVPESQDVDYVVQLRDERGRFVKDPFANYRRGELDDNLLDEIKKNTKGTEYE